MLLADQDSKIDKYKAKLREAGVQVCWLSYVWDMKIDKYKAKLREAGVQVCWLSYVWDMKIDKYKAKLREAGVQVCWLSYHDRQVQGQAQGGRRPGLLA